MQEIDQDTASMLLIKWHSIYKQRSIFTLIALPKDDEIAEDRGNNEEGQEGRHPHVTRNDRTLPRTTGEGAEGGEVVK